MVTAERGSRVNQSSSTGGLSASVNTGIDCLICCWLAQSMRWVLITPLGSLVEPLVNRNLAMVSVRSQRGRRLPQWSALSRAVRECNDGASLARARSRIVTDHRRIGSHGGGVDGAAVTIIKVGGDTPRSVIVEHMAQLQNPDSPARVGRRHRANTARRRTSQPEQRVLNAVLRLRIASGCSMALASRAALARCRGSASP